MVQLLVSLFVTQAQASSTETVNIVVDDFPPYVNQQQPPGVITKLVKKAFAEQGIETNIEYKPWSEVETMIDNDKKLSFMWSRTVQRTQKWIYSDPVYANRQILVVKKHSGVFWRRLDQLRQYNLGVTAHHNYGDNFEQYRQYLNLTDSASDFLSLKKLVRGKVDAVIVEELEGRHLILVFSRKSKTTAGSVRSQSAGYKQLLFGLFKKLRQVLAFYSKF